MTLTTLLTILVFMIGLYFYARCADPKYAEGFSNQDKKPRCPNLLIQKGAKFYLYNSKLAEVPGVNPIEFDNLEDLKIVVFNFVSKLKNYIIKNICIVSYMDI